MKNFINCMKKSILIIVMVAAATLFTTANAQPQAIGGRLGYGIGLSYLHGIGDNTGINLDVNFFRFNGLEVVATHDWLFPINSWQEAGTWTWFAGVGAGVGFAFNSYGYAGVAGRIGVKYEFETVPLELGLDYRPVIGPTFYKGGAGFFDGGFIAPALSVRYTF